MIDSLTRNRSQSSGLRLAALLFLLPAFLPAALTRDIRLDDFEYPFTTQTYAFQNQAQALEMAYMDIGPEAKPRATVVLMHGKNFSGAYFEQTAAELRRAGYRVIMPDQIGFGKSTKPPHYQYSFHQLAESTRSLLDNLGVERAHVLGHSMGGMLAARFALMYPESTQSLTLLNPIGLEDWKAKGVPYRSTTDLYLEELAKTPGKIRSYQKESYYDGEWRDEYDRWVEMLAQFIESEDYPRVAWNQALTYDMIYTQPVLYEFGRLRVPTLLIIGQRDQTALGKDLVSKEKRAELGNYRDLGRAAREAIPKATLVELQDVGHLPHIEAFDRFFPPLRDFLNQQEAEPR